MYVNKDNWEDCQKYYLHTYTKFKETGDTIFYIETVSPEAIIAKDLNNNKIGIDLFEGYTLEYVLPHKTIYQYGDTACILYRVPAKQWKKGLCSSNTEMSGLYNSGWSPMSFDIDAIEGFVNKPSYIPADYALEKLKNGMSSVALSPRFSICSKGDIYLDMSKVANFNFETNIIKAKKILIPEIKALFPTFKVI